MDMFDFVGGDFDKSWDAFVRDHPDIRAKHPPEELEELKNKARKALKIAGLVPPDQEDITQAYVRNVQSALMGCDHHNHDKEREAMVVIIRSKMHVEHMGEAQARAFCQILANYVLHNEGFGLLAHDRHDDLVNIMVMMGAMYEAAKNPRLLDMKPNSVEGMPHTHKEEL